MVLLIPCLATTVKRLHDVNKSGWLLLLLLLPIAGVVWILLLLLADSDLSDNKYGNKLSTKTTKNNKAMLFVPLVLLASILLTCFAIGDMYRLGDEKWSGYDKARIKVYLRTCAFIGSFVPPVTDFLAWIHYPSVLTSAYVSGK
jgi:hypothetical protein